MQDNKELVEKISDYLSSNKFDKATSLLRNKLQQNPKDPFVHSLLGEVLLTSQAQDRARKHLETAVNLEPTDGKLWRKLGFFYKKNNQLDSVVNLYKKALEIVKDDKEANNIKYELAETLHKLNRDEQALPLVQELIKADENNIRYGLLFIEIIKDLKIKRQATKAIFNIFVESDEEYPSYIMDNWLRLMFEADMVIEAKKAIEIKLQKFPKHIPYLVAMVNIETLLNRHDEAIRYGESVLKDEPKNQFVIAQLIQAYRSIGELDTAQQYNQKLLDINPYLATSILTYIYNSKSVKFGDDVYNRVIKGMSQITYYESFDKVAIMYAMGMLLEKLDDIDNAFLYYKKAGHMHITNRTTETPTIHKNLRRLKKYFNQEFIDNIPKLGYRDKKPIFIVGMPRSGTTLLEQVLSSLDGVYGVGESVYAGNALHNLEVVGERLKTSIGSPFEENITATFSERGQYYIDRVSNLLYDKVDIKRIVDKMPGNFLWLGLIYAMLPDAKFINARRHPMDICLSAYKILFADAQYWSYDLVEMGRYYRAYVEVMKFWKSILPKDLIIDVYYENMVDDLETQSKIISNHIGVEWTDKCLEFHKNKNAVNTASLSQVRQPIYKTSVAKWKKYEKQLKPLYDEIADLVEEYELELESNRKNRGN